MPISQAKKLELITKHGRKFASKSEATPILQGIRYQADGSVVVTDRVKLLRIGGAHNFSEPFTSHAVTGAPIDGQYPDTSRIIPTDLPAQITLINGHNRDDIKEAIARVKLAVDAAKVTGNKTFLMTLEKAADYASLTAGSAEDGITLAAKINADLYGENVTVSLNAEYLLAALNVFKDAGSRRVVIGLTGAASPIVLRDEENEIDAIVLPYRLGGAA